MRQTFTGVASLACTVLIAAAPHAQTPSTKEYLFFVASEGNDQIALVRFGPTGARVERQFRISTNPTELLGPHGLAVAPDGRHYYVTTGHGNPFGALWKFTTQGDTLKGRVELGNFPATMQVSPDGAYVFVVNFNLHGDMVPSSVSIVAAGEMLEVARVRTCTMPHGSRLNPQGTKHYSACMMDDMLVEIDARDFSIARHFMLARGREHGMSGPPTPMAGHSMRGDAGRMPHTPDCSPTWAQPSSDGASIFVACTKSNEIVEIDARAWRVTRRIAAGNGVYNLAVTRDGRLLVATNKRAQSVSVIEIASGRELARVPTTRKVASGVAISSDDRFAFVSVEGSGSQPGTVDIIDLVRMQTAATVEVGQQAGGIDFWKMDGRMD